MGCAQVLGEQPKVTSECLVRVYADEDTPIERVALTTGGETVTTDERGEAVVVLRGHEGDRRQVNVRCPDQFQPPSAPLAVTLRSASQRSQRDRYDVFCAPLRRKVVVAARVEGGAGLPINFLGREVARLDEDGTANALLELAVGEPFRVSIDTSSRPALRPQHPVFDYPAGDIDDVLLLQHKFTVFVPKPIVKKRGRPRPTRL